MIHLNHLEERILEFLIQYGKLGQQINICFSDEVASDLTDAIVSLDTYGYAINCNNLNGANAMLKLNGQYYFNDKNREQYNNGYYGRIAQIEEWIIEVANTKDDNNLSILVDRILSTFKTASNIYGDNFKYVKFTSVFKTLPSAYFDRQETAIKILTNCLSATKNEAIYFEKESVKAQINSLPKVVNEYNPTYDFSLSSAVSNMAICSEVSNENKLELKTMLCGIQQDEQDNNELWIKVKKTTYFALKLGSETTKAIMPYLLEVLKSIK